MNGTPILRHVGIPVKNLETSIEFYHNLGFRMVRFTREKWARELQIVKLRGNLDAAQLELIEGVWQPHFAISVPDIDEWKSQVEFGNGEAHYIKDPDGNWVELVEVRE